jgi:hypothetical protein
LESPFQSTKKIERNSTKLRLFKTEPGIDYRFNSGESIESGSQEIRKTDLERT